MCIVTTRVEDDEEKNITHLLLEVNLTATLALPKVKERHILSECIKMKPSINKSDI